MRYISIPIAICTVDKYLAYRIADDCGTFRNTFRTTILQRQSLLVDCCCHLLISIFLMYFRRKITEVICMIWTEISMLPMATEKEGDVNILTDSFKTHCVEFVDTLRPGVLVETSLKPQ